jgi:hypothetical protein
LKYRVYIDEVGNSDLESADNPNHRFLSLTGVIFDLEHIAQVVQPQLETLKGEFFGSHPDDPIILHRKEMHNWKGAFHVLENPSLRERFDRKLLTFLSDWQYTVVTVCLDKKLHKEHYQTWRYDPYHYCMALLLERYVLLLKRNGALGDVMAESRGGKEDMRLKESFQRLWESGTDFVSHEMFQAHLTSRQLQLRSKVSNIAGLQIADLLAHTSRKEMLLAHKLIADDLTEFAQQIKAILMKKYDRSGNRIFGRKML